MAEQRVLEPTLEDYEILFSRLIEKNPGIEALMKNIILERLLNEREAELAAYKEAPQSNGILDPCLRE